MTSKERAIATIKGEPVDTIPVFPLLMGFSAKRSGFTYKQFASNGRAMAEAQLRILDDFDIDVITACSDAFRISTDLGGDVVYCVNTPPYIKQPIITSSQDLSRLSKIDVTRPGSRCADRVLGVEEMVKAAGDTHLIVGWVDFPFAEACSCCGVQNFMLLILDEPALAHAILQFLTDIVIDFALAQLEKGAPMIGCGDAAASLVSNETFREFALPYEKQVVDKIHSHNGLVKTHICGNTTNILESETDNGSDLYNVDHMVDLKHATDVFSSHGRAFKGNIDPVYILSSSPEQVFAAAKSCIDLADSKKYFLSAGCEIPPNTPDENLKAFCMAAKQS